MTEQEVRDTYKELKDEGLSEEDILNSLGTMFINEDISKEELIAFMNVLDYDFSDELKDLSEDELRSKLKEDKEEGENQLAEDLGVSEEAVEESGDKPAPTSKDKPADDDKDTSDSDKDTSNEEDEKNKALKLMGL